MQNDESVKGVIEFNLSGNANPVCGRYQWGSLEETIARRDLLFRCCYCLTKGSTVPRLNGHSKAVV
jgi:hypothetical protein